MNWDDTSVLITGGTGSFGKKCAEFLLKTHSLKRLVIYSRDELKQFEMGHDPKFAHEPRLRYFIGDVRDKERLARAFEGIDYVIHAAALKQVPAAEYNPFEAVKTNIHGAQNVIDCAIDKGVSRVIALSTDKAANPVNLYGATKLCSDKLFIAGNSYAGLKKTCFAVVRYGNVVGSRGSVVPFFLKKRHDGVLPVTDARMTRFWITLEQGTRFVLEALEHARGGEIFVPKIPSLRMTDLARAIAPGAQHEIVGIRPGEKLHEVLISEDDARHTVELEDRFVILPDFGLSFHSKDARSYWQKQGAVCADGFSYTSDTNPAWLSADEINRIIARIDSSEAREWAQERGLA